MMLPLSVTRGDDRRRDGDNRNKLFGRARRSLVAVLNCIRRSIPQRQQHGSVATFIRASFVCVSLYILLYKIFVADTRLPPIDWANKTWAPEYHPHLTACQKTLFQPFRVGCPTTCRRAGENETMYRMNAAWYFGHTNNLTVLDPNVLPTAYDMGINYQAPYAFMQAFIGASRQLQSKVNDYNQENKFPPGLQVIPQKHAHMSLAYFCCLRKNETDWIREIVAEWITELHPFDFDVSFAGLQCWHEWYNSITNILVVDERTQRIVMDMVHSLYDKIEHQYHIPMEISREQQMPIHLTLAGLRYGKGESMLPEHNITPILSDVFNVISSIDQQYAGQWIGPPKSAPKLQVTHNPKYSTKGKVHNH